jgi:hypothetical protein
MAEEFFRSGWDAHGTDDSEAGGVYIGDKIGLEREKPGNSRFARYKYFIYKEPIFKTGKFPVFEEQYLSDRKTTQYQGEALSSLQRCFWKVRVWNDYDTQGGYSEPASWQMGLLFFDDPEAK